MADRFYDHPSGVAAPSVTNIMKIVYSESLERYKMNQVRDFCLQPGATKAGANEFMGMIGMSEADKGTWLHEIAEKTIQGDDSLPEPIKGAEKQCENLVYNLQVFFNSLPENWMPLATEVVLHGELSGKPVAYYSGTADAVIQVDDNRRAMIDFKTSKAPYDNYGAQLAAYAKAWNETYPQEKVNRLWLVRIDKNKKIDNPEIHEPDPHLSMALFKSSILTWYITNKMWGSIFK